MDRFELLTAFVRTVELKSLSAAARDLGTTQPTVSRWLRALETRTKARLLWRNTHGLRLTEAGERLYVVSKRILADLALAEASASKTAEVVEGKLRLNFPVGFGELHLTRLALEFQRQHPALELDLTLTDRVVDLVEDGVDLAVRMGGVRDPAVVAKPLGTFRYWLVATKEYLARHGTPREPEELSQHNFLGYGVEATEPLLTPRGLVEVPVRTNLSCNNSLALRTAALAGGGIARTTEWLTFDAVQAGQLQVVLPGVAPAPLLTHAVYLPSQFLPVKVRRFAEFLSREIRKVPGWRAASTTSL